MSSRDVYSDLISSSTIKGKSIKTIIEEIGDASDLIALRDRVKEAFSRTPQVVIIENAESINLPNQIANEIKGDIMKAIDRRVKLALLAIQELGVDVEGINETP